MKNLIFATLFFLSAIIYAQKVNSIENHQTHLILNNSVELSINSEIQILLPSNGKNFKFVMKYVQPDGPGIITDLDKFELSKASTKYPPDALQDINKLDISSTAKEIAGRNFIVSGWEVTPEGLLLSGFINNNKYMLYLEQALNTNEILLNGLSSKSKNEYNLDTDREIMRKTMETFKHKF